MEERYLIHWGILGQKWGIRRYQNPDGTLTEAGKARYYKTDGSLTNEGRKWQAKERKERLKHPELMTEEELDAEIKRMGKEINLKALMDKLPSENPTKAEKKRQTLEDDIKTLELEVKKKDLEDQKNRKGKYDPKNQNNGGGGKKNKGGNNGGGNNGGKERDAFDPNRSLINLLWNASKASFAKYTKDHIAKSVMEDKKNPHVSDEKRMKDAVKRYEERNNVGLLTDAELDAKIARNEKEIQVNKQNDQLRKIEEEAARRRNGAVKHSAILIHSATSSRILIRKG